jgi:hypothetical protein
MFKISKITFLLERKKRKKENTFYYTAHTSKYLEKIDDKNNNYKRK